MLFTSSFWVSALERAVKTLCQSLLAMLTVAPAFNVLNVSWANALGVAAGAAILSLLTSMASINIGPAGSPSLVGNGSGGGKHETTE
jgi:hypothetical protein